MCGQARSSDQPQTLDILGFSRAEERMYRWLVEHPGAVVTEAAQALNLTMDKTRRLLDVIESKGLASHTPKHPRQFLPVSPDVALETFALRREEDLRRARDSIRELQGQAEKAQAHKDRVSTVELIASHDIVRKTFEHMQRTAKHEIISLFRPPVYVTNLNAMPEETQESQRAGQARGVRHRVIASELLFDVPNVWRLIRDDIESGQEYRVMPSLPFKMFVADRRVALIPVSLEQEDSSTLLIRSPMLIDGLCALFDTLWEMAKPIGIAEGDMQKSDRAGARWPDEVEELIFMLAAGLNDKKITKEMGISSSTLSRRLATIGQALGARTRFQLGWLAGRHFAGEPTKK